MRPALVLLTVLSFSHLLSANKIDLSFDGTIEKIFACKESGLLYFIDDNDQCFEYNGIHLRQKFNAYKLLGINNGKFYLSKSNSLFKYTQSTEKIQPLPIPLDRNIRNIYFLGEKLIIVSDSQIRITDENYSSHQLKFKQRVDGISSIFCGNSTCFYSQGNQVFDLFNDELLFQTNDSCLDICQSKSGDLIVASSYDTNICREGTCRILNAASGYMPSDPRKLVDSYDDLYIINATDVHRFSWAESSVELIEKIEGIFLDAKIDAWNGLWLATTQGVYHIKNPKKNSEPIIHNSYIENANGIKQNDSKYSWNENEEAIKIYLNSTFLPNPANLKTQYNLNEQGWKNLTRSVLYLTKSLLSNGDNEILMRSRSGNNISEVRRFTIKIPHQEVGSTLWKLLLGSLGFLFAIALISLLNLRNNNKVIQSEIEKLRSQNKLLQKEQQVDQLRMNPHFIFNSLNSIKGLLSQNKIPEARQSITLFSSFLRKYLYQTEGENTMLSDEIEMLKSYLKLEQLCRPFKFKFIIEVEDEELLDLWVPNMIVQPFLENALVHGFNADSENALLTLKFSESQNYLVAEVRDNGVGFQKELKENKSHKSVAVDLTEKRLASIDKNRQSAYVTYDHTVDGTLVRIKLSRI